MKGKYKHNFHLKAPIINNKTWKAPKEVNIQARIHRKRLAGTQKGEGKKNIRNISVTWYFRLGGKEETLSAKTRENCLLVHLTYQKTYPGSDIF